MVSEKRSIARAITSVGISLGVLTEDPPMLAFRTAYSIDQNNPLIFNRDPMKWDSKLNDWVELTLGGYTRGARLISVISWFTYGDVSLRNRNFIIHELGHAFNWAMGGTPYIEMDKAIDEDLLLARSDDYSLNYGFASPLEERVWVQNPENKHYEIFADQFLGWTFDFWETGSDGSLTDAAFARANWMDENMLKWLIGP